MGARRTLHLTTDPTLITVGTTAGTDCSGFRVFRADGTTPVSNYTAWSNGTKTGLVTGDKLSIAEDQIYVFLGLTGTPNGALDNNFLIAMLNNATVGLLATDRIYFYSNSTTQVSTSILPYQTVSSIGSWDTAVAY
jgi:hypothetical protein